MKSCVLILPYFGKFPENFPLFIDTFSFNQSFQLLIFTDCHEQITYPDNVEVIYESFSTFADRFSRKIDPRIHLTSPYKLCDFKPTYGDVLCEYISQYDYWGHCDCDMVFGDLDTLLQPLMEAEYDKIFSLGHLTLYKNTLENNRIYLDTYKGKKICETFFFADPIGGFDEDFFTENIHTLFLQRGKRVYGIDMSINPCVKTDQFSRTQYDAQTRGFITIPHQGERYYWKRGHLYQLRKVQDTILWEEFLYMHFQLRSMRVPKGQNDYKNNTIRIVPNRFILCDSIPQSVDEWNHDRRIFLSGQRIKMNIGRIKRLIQKLHKHL